MVIKITELFSLVFLSLFFFLSFYGAILRTFKATLKFLLQFITIDRQLYSIYDIELYIPTKKRSKMIFQQQLISGYLFLRPVFILEIKTGLVWMKRNCLSKDSPSSGIRWPQRKDFWVRVYTVALGIHVTCFLLNLSCHSGFKCNKYFLHNTSILFFIQYTHPLAWRIKIRPVSCDTGTLFTFSLCNGNSWCVWMRFQFSK